MPINDHADSLIFAVKGQDLGSIEIPKVGPTNSPLPTDFHFPQLPSPWACVRFTNGPHESTQNTEGSPTAYHVAENRLTCKVQGTHRWYQQCASSLHAQGADDIQKTWPVCLLTFLILFLTLLGLSDGSVTHSILVGRLERSLVTQMLGMHLSVNSWMILMKVCPPTRLSSSSSN